MPHPVPENSRTPVAGIVSIGIAFIGAGVALALVGQFGLRSIPMFGAGIGVLGVGVAYIAMSILRKP